ncbi:MAG: SDR family oxidoreductase [Sandaracinus sp.]|nr:SDR family oxidoreductase [Sandaracinus sp.]
MPFTENDLPNLQGRHVVVTGANSGIGLEAARALAGAGAHVVLACRSRDKGERAMAEIRLATPKANLTLESLDLASLESIRGFAERMSTALPSIDVLVNNAGIMAIPRTTTADGFEMQMGTNHLGHFALTGRLLPLLLAAPSSRVVNVSSLGHRFVHRVKLDDLHATRGYQKWIVYCRTKLANLLFTFELQRRFEAARKNAIAVACHPGFSNTNLQFVGPRLEGSKLMEAVMRWNNTYLAQSAREGALPTLYAATASDVRGGEYFGPNGLFEIRGTPTRAHVARPARDAQAARALFELSERETGVRYDFHAPAPSVHLS